jgi:hypothetical protein
MGDGGQQREGGEEHEEEGKRRGLKEKEEGVEVASK